MSSGAFFPKSSYHINQEPQYDFARSLAEQINMSRMPPPEPELFDGNPLKYQAWAAAFETLVEQKSVKPAERIYYLKRYLTGQAKEAVEGYFMLSTSDSTYLEAKALLAQRFGDPFVVANAFRSKLDSWPKIAAKDCADLRKLADFLRQCDAAMKTNSYLHILSDPHQNHKILAILPEWMVPRWGRIVAAEKGHAGMFPNFTQFVKFVEYEAKIANDPVASLHALKTEGTKPLRSPPSRSLATGTTSTEIKVCPLCKKGHSLEVCKKPLTDVKAHIRENGLCFGCLKPGHLSKFCKQRAKCSTCNKRHPSCLHGDIRDPKKSPRKVEGQPPIESVTGVTHLNDTSNTSKSSMIVPVWVSHSSQPDGEVLVYALLDSQSDTTFILDEVRTDLGVTGHDVKLSLSTMAAKDQIVESRRVNGFVGV
jgi:hypothetical protein